MECVCRDSGSGGLVVGGLLSSDIDLLIINKSHLAMALPDIMRSGAFNRNVEHVERCWREYVSACVSVCLFRVPNRWCIILPFSMCLCVCCILKSWVVNVTYALWHRKIYEVKNNNSGIFNQGERGS